MHFIAFGMRKRDRAPIHLRIIGKWFCGPGLAERRNASHQKCAHVPFVRRVKGTCVAWIKPTV